MQTSALYPALIQGIPGLRGEKGESGHLGSKVNVT